MKLISMPKRVETASDYDWEKVLTETAGDQPMAAPSAYCEPSNEGESAGDIPIEKPHSAEINREAIEAWRHVRASIANSQSVLFARLVYDTQGSLRCRLVVQAIYQIASCDPNLRYADIHLLVFGLMGAPPSLVKDVEEYVEAILNQNCVNSSLRTGWEYVKFGAGYRPAA
jgi:hypothetical protein